jgi:hypothetical protein
MNTSTRPRMLALALLGCALSCALWCAACPGGTSTTGSASKPADVAAAGGFVIANPSNPRANYHDFGHLLFGERVKHVFQLENREGRDITIQDLLPSCSCAVPRVSYVGANGQRVQGVVERGANAITVPKNTTLDVEIEMDTTHVEVMNADKLTTVRIRSDSSATPYLTLECHLVVVRAFRAVPPKVDLGLTPESFGKSGRTDITTDVRGNGARIGKIDAITGPFTAEIEEKTIAGESVWILSVSALPGQSLGPIQGEIALTSTKADGTPGQVFTVPVLAQITTDVVVHPGVFQLGQIERGKASTLEGELSTLVPGETVKILSSKIVGQASEHMSFDTKALNPDDSGRAARWAFALNVDEKLAEPSFGGVVEITLDSKTTPVLTVTYAGRLK